MEYADQSVGEFLSNVASERVSPAGGTVAAVVGATGASVCEMVCLHALEGRESPDRELIDARGELATQRDHLLGLAGADATAVDALFADTGGEPGETELKRATGVPLTIAAASLTVFESGVVALAAGEETTVADGMTGVLLTDAALRSAVYTVRTNLAHVEDIAFERKLRERTDEVETGGERALARATAIAPM